jgi:hypothetical protein
MIHGADVMEMRSRPQAYVDAGRSDRHYKILASPRYRAVSCGSVIVGSEVWLAGSHTQQ